MRLLTHSRSSSDIVAGYIPRVRTAKRFEQPKPHDDEYQLFLHQLWRNLARGSHTNSSNVRRPAFPHELIVIIFRLADFCIPIPALDVSSTEYGWCVVEGNLDYPSVRTWICSPPICAPMLRLLRRSVARLEIEIVSRDQGFRVGGIHSANDNDSSSTSTAQVYSWFELALYRRDPGRFREDELRIAVKDGKLVPLVWMIFQNDRGAIEFRRKVVVLDASHAVWRYLEEGDVLCVRVCAQYSPWANYAKEGHLRFFRYFEPV